MDKYISGFKFKAVKKTVKRNSNKPKKVSRLCVGVCNKEGDDWTIRLNLKDDERYPNELVLPFTDTSKSLYGKTKIFSKEKDEHGNIVCYVRHEDKAKWFPGSEDAYTPFNNGWAYSGYIVSINGKLYFEIVEALACAKLYYAQLESSNVKPLQIHR